MSYWKDGKTFLWYLSGDFDDGFLAGWEENEVRYVGHVENSCVECKKRKAVEKKGEFFQPLNAQDKEGLVKEYVEFMDEYLKEGNV